MTTGCYETSLLLYANARGAGTLLTVKWPSPGTHHETNARGLPGGGWMLAVGIDLHITEMLFLGVWARHRMDIATKHNTHFHIVEGRDRI